MKLPLTREMEKALPVITTLQSGGYEAVFVGGAVRDAVLGLTVNDVDIATSALPEEVMSLFPKCIPTGLQHGTVTVIHEGVPYEVTTYRTESQYEQYRKPASVEFVKRLDEDLQRRDFTMNAMAIRQDGELYDPYHGLEDLNAGLLRPVGDGDARFQEDALRMLRAVRFMGVYRLSPVLSLWRAIRKHRALLKHIAMERISAELDKVMASAKPQISLDWLLASGLMLELKEPLSPPLCARLKGGRNWLGQLVGKIDHLCDQDERWSALLLSLGVSSEQAKGLLQSLRLPGKRAERICSIIVMHEQMKDDFVKDVSHKAAMSHWREAVIEQGENAARAWLRVAGVLREEDALATEQADRLQAELHNMPIKTLKELAVGGGDLQSALGRKAGPWLKFMLRRLLLEVAAGNAVNRKPELLQLCTKWNEEDRKHEHK